jgi:hypothetical protein
MSRSDGFGVNFRLSDQSVEWDAPALPMISRQVDGLENVAPAGGQLAGVFGDPGSLPIPDVIPPTGRLSWPIAATSA